MNANSIAMVVIVALCIATIGMVIRMNQLDDALYKQNEDYQNLVAIVDELLTHEQTHPSGVTEALGAARKQIRYDVGNWLDIFEMRLRNVENCLYPELKEEDKKEEEKHEED